MPRNHPKPQPLSSNMPRKATARFTVEQAIEERLAVRDKYERLLADHGTSQDKTKELRSIATHDCELTALIEGNNEAKALMQMRTMQISMLLIREASSSNTSVFEQMLTQARGRALPTSVDTTPPVVVSAEHLPHLSTPAPAATPTGAQAALLSIVPKIRERKDLSDPELATARKVLADYGTSDRKGKTAVPEEVLNACRVLLAAGVTSTEICQLADLSRMTLHRYGVKAS